MPVQINLYLFKAVDMPINLLCTGKCYTFIQERFYG
jgi:hypothetical protein